MSFPAAIVDCLKLNLARTPLDGASVTVLGRSLRPTDPNHSIGIVTGEWVPEDWEIGGSEPSMARYTFQVQYLVKHAAEDVGRALHAAGSKSIRSMLYRDDALRVALRGLSDSEMGTTERILRLGVQRQQFRSNEMRGQFMFVSSLALWVEVNV